MTRDMEEVTNANLFELWKKKRNLTTIAFTTQSLLLGMEYSITFLTLWLYLKALVSEENANLFYGLVSASYLLMAVVCSLALSAVVDRYRCIKKTFIGMNILLIIGNIVYSLPFSPYLLITGRLISGCGGLLRSVIASELTRIYSADKISSYYSIMGMAYSFGFITGPLINFAFLSVNLQIGSWKITYANMPLLFMSFMFVLQLILCSVFLYDCSKEYDMKKETIEKLDDEDEDLASEGDLLMKSSSNEEESLNIEIIKSMFACFDISLAFAASFFVTFSIVCFEMWWPLLIIDTMHWTVVALNITTFGAATAAVGGCILIIVKTFSDKQIYYMSLCCMLGFIMMEISYIFLKNFHQVSVSVDVCLWAMFCVLFACQIIYEDVFLVNAIAKMVSSKYQTFADSIRLSFSRLGALSGMLSAPFLFKYLTIAGLIIIGIILSGCFILVVRRKTFQNPAIIIK